jgi:hypothetical protein
VADKLGIDLIWFGVLLAVNMQTSFMHPPFGFALFYLRSVAPAKQYVDKITGKMTAPITTGQIYWGAVPFVVIQVIMVGIVIAFPGLVTGNLDHSSVDASKVEIVIPATGYDDEPAGEDAAPGYPEATDEPGANDLERAFGAQQDTDEAPAEDSPGSGDPGLSDLEKDLLGR